MQKQNYSSIELITINVVLKIYLTRQPSTKRLYFKNISTTKQIFFRGATCISKKYLFSKTCFLLIYTCFYSCQNNIPFISKEKNPVADLEYFHRHSSQYFHWLSEISSTQYRSYHFYETA